MTTASPLMGSEPLLSDPRFCRSMRTFRKLRKMCQHPDDDLVVIFKEVLDSRTRLEHRLRDVEEKVSVAATATITASSSTTAPPPSTTHRSPLSLQLEEMDAKFEHNIASMNELLQKNLKYLKHVAQP